MSFGNSTSWRDQEFLGTPENPLIAAPAAAAPPTAFRVLVADDDDATRIAVAYILQREGFVVTTARDGAAAVALARAGQFHAVVMDVQMPHMDGLRAMSLLRRIPACQHLPVIFLSQLFSLPLADTALQRGAHEYVNKQNFDPAALVTKLRQLCQTAATQHCAALLSATRRTEAPGSSDPLLDVRAWARQAAAQFPPGFRAALASCAALPTVLPAVRRELATALRQGVPLERLADLVEQEPGLLIPVLTAASRMCRENQWLGARQACQLLGHAPLAKVIAATLDASTPPASTESVRRWWSHQQATAHAAGALARAFGADEDVARTAAWLGQLGRLLLLTGPGADAMVAAYDTSPRWRFATDDAELALLGAAQSELATRWLEPHPQAAALLKLSSTEYGVMPTHRRVDDARPLLTDILIAARALAVAWGFSGLPGDSIEPLPARFHACDRAVVGAVDAAFAQAQRQLHFRLGAAAPTQSSADLNGITIAFLTPVSGALNPFIRLLRQAGARICAHTRPEHLLLEEEPQDVLVIDHVHAGAGLDRSMLRRICAAPMWSECPRLVLTRQPAPEVAAGASARDTVTYTAPIRDSALCNTISQLLGQLV